jgi:hypothetical protein
MGTLHEDWCTCMIISKFFLEWDVLNKSCRENNNTFYLFISEKLYQLGDFARKHQIRINKW